MNRLTLVFAVLCIAASFPVAAQNNVPPDIREMARRVNMPVVLTVPGMADVKVVENLKYSDANDANLLMDVYVPPNIAKTEKRPVVIFIHGGARSEWTPKDWGVYKTWGRLIAASGFVGVTFTHRLEYPARSLETGAKDVTDAIKYFRMHADKYNADRDRISLIGYSAAGPMLTLGMRGETPYIKCLVAFYAFMDVQRAEHRKTEGAAALTTFSAVTYLEKNPQLLPPMFIARAGRDEIPMMNDSIDRFINLAISKNIELSFANHTNGVHGLDNQNDDARSREIIQNVIAFLKTNLK
ncbi:MAG TPA: alpha/beta hydrolase [Pyrinomonadaceae bacterium]|nr:alpha/beta hydrolase [Pyrinomonadaceae bacterium]